ncbi:MAG: hypothetical protein LBO74_05880 [Candidatus Symbiothrix sp.]|jgi:hypothetical protein|nr:hypothetical protein [Candidatus Symbiothrix sp.]
MSELKKTGKCINFGNCAKADRHEIIELDFTEDFVCPECNSDLLEEHTGKKGGKGAPKKGLLIGAIAAVVLLGGAAAFFLTKDKEEIATEETTITPPAALEEPIVVEEPIVIDTPVVAEPPIEEQVVEKPVVKEPVVKESKPSAPSSGTLNLGYGTYTGQIKNGKANGSGRLVFKTNHIISEYDKGQKRTAEPGDYIEGQFENNNFYSGKWFGKDNNQKGAIILQKSGL